VSEHNKLAYSISAFAEIAGLGRSFIYEEIQAGRLKVRKAGRRTIILENEARGYLDSLPAVEPVPSAAGADQAPLPNRCGS
jgi:hypothetical protein